MRPNVTKGRNYNLGLEFAGYNKNKNLKDSSLINAGVNMGWGIFSIITIFDGVLSVIMV